MVKIRYTIAFAFSFIFLFIGKASAQHNIYINSNGRTNIINGVSNITYDSEFAQLFVDTTKYEVGLSGISQMSLCEKDSWKSKIMPERYLGDFDYDISFSESDKSQMKEEQEVLDKGDDIYEDFVSHSVWNKIVNIRYDGNKVVTSGDVDSVEISIDGSHVTVRSTLPGIHYVLSGSSENGSFKIYSEKKSYLTLNGLSLTNPQGPVINSQSKKRLFIEIAEGTKNTLVDGSTYTKVSGEDQRGCLFAEGKICISGKGELYVYGNKKCGIASDNYIHFTDGFINVTSTAEKGKAVYGKDNIIIGGGVLRTYTSGDASKGITSDSLLVISGGLVKSITIGNAIWEEEKQDYSSCCAIKSEYDMKILGGDIYCLSTGSGGKGISAGNSITEVINGKEKTTYNGTLTIDNASIYVRTSGRRIPVEKEEDSHGAKLGASASPKGMKSASKMIINSGEIYIRCSGGAAAEGVESKRSIEINGGKLRSYCVDDGMNAEGLTVRGGDVLVCSTENDGLDVSYLYLYDGSLYCVGADKDQMGLDTDGKTFKVQGGNLVGVGARNCQPYSSSAQANVLCDIKRSASFVALADADGNVLQVIPTPDTYSVLSVLLSSDKLVVGNNYQILSYRSSLSDIPFVEYEFKAEGISTKLESK